MLTSAFRPVLLLVASFLLFCPALVAAEDPLIGSKPSAWQVSDWMNSEALTLKDLAGKVILIRWWMAPGCPFCAATAPALNEFHKEYQEKGLVVIGFYHHKVRTPLDAERVKRSAEKLGFQFPIAIDRDWRTLKRWWLDKGDRRWTSVTFLIDRQGVIRHIHPGGQYVKGDKAYSALKKKIEELIKEE